MLLPSTQTEDLYFRKLRKGDLNLTLEWRNKPHVRNEMVSRKPISASEHNKWFEGIGTRNEQHFVYSQKNIDIGALNLKLCGDGVSFEAGIYCGREEYLGHSLNIYALISLYDYAFGPKRLSRAFGRVLETNLKARRLNSFLGYVEEGEISQGLVRLRLEKQTFLKNREKIMRTGRPPVSVSKEH